MWTDAGFIKAKDEELTPQRLKLLVWAGEDLPYAQHLRGIKYLLRHCQYMPNGAQYRAACLGVPVGSLTTSPSDPTGAEVNRLWAWPLKWIPWFDQCQGTITIHAFDTNAETFELSLEHFATGSFAAYFRGPDYRTLGDKVAAANMQRRVAAVQLDQYKKTYYHGRGEQLVARAKKWIDYYEQFLISVGGDLRYAQGVAEQYSWSADLDIETTAHKMGFSKENLALGFGALNYKKCIEKAKSIKKTVACIPAQEGQITWLEQRLVKGREDLEEAHLMVEADAMTVKTNIKQYEDAIDDASSAVLVACRR
jgi:hypothetical protein